MMKDKYEKIMERFESYYPYLYEKTIDWWPSGRLCITAKLRDDTLIEFDSSDNTFRRIQPKNYNKDADRLKKDIGYNIRKMINTRGMPQSDIAERCGITEAMLSRYLHGTSMPGLDKIYSLASVLDCRVADILDESYYE